MQGFRKKITVLLPVIAILMIAALLLSRVFEPKTSQTPERSIHSSEAASWEGRYVEVCGDVVQATLMPEIGGSPVFLNFGDAHPNQEFTIVIWQRYHRLWEQPPHQIYRGQPVCAEGEIEMHRGAPQIEIRRPDQMRITRR